MAELELKPRPSGPEPPLCLTFAWKLAQVTCSRGRPALGKVLGPVEAWMTEGGNASAFGRSSALEPRGQVPALVGSRSNASVCKSVWFELEILPQSSSESKWITQFSPVKRTSTPSISPAPYFLGQQSYNVLCGIIP